VPNTFAAQYLALDVDDVYFASFSSLARVSKGGGTPSAIASGSYSVPIAVDATHVYLFDGTDRHLFKINKLGGTPYALGGAETGVPQALEVVGGYVYWTAYPGGAKRVSVAGGAVETLSDASQYPLGMAVDATHVYWSNLIGQSIARAPIGGGANEVIATGLLAPNHLSVQGSELFYGDVSTIQAIPKSGGAARVVTDALPLDATVDATHVYWTSSTARRVARAPLAGGSPEVIADELHSPLSIAVDSTHVYFVDDSAIFVAPKGCSLP
jgi:hypothetical protein